MLGRFVQVFRDDILPTEQQSFDALKAALTSAPVRVWDPARPTRLLADASELAVSASPTTQVRFTLLLSSRVN